MSESATFPHHGEAEQWLPVAGYEALYAVSDLGRVRSTRRQGTCGGLKKPQLSSHGYRQIALYCGGEESIRAVHRLVLEAFVGPCPPGMECRHGPGGRLDNRLVNLCWGTKSDNCGPDKVRDGTDQRGEQMWSAKLTEEKVVEIRRRYAAGETQKSISGRYHVGRKAVSKIVRSERWAHVAGGPSEVREQTRLSGEDHGCAVLTWAIVAEIRRRYAAGGVTYRELGAEHGVSIAAIARIVKGEAWKQSA